MNDTSYKYYTIKHAKSSNLLKDSVFAFLFGGTICLIAEILLSVYEMLRISEENARISATLTLIFFTCLLTGIGVFDKIAKIGGAGTFVPITGFANAVVSPAIDYTAEGLVLGMASKMFIIAGPVIVYGTVSSVIYGIIYWIFLVLQ